LVPFISGVGWRTEQTYSLGMEKWGWDVVMLVVQNVPNV
jgi:hypothetical protein